MLQWLNNNPGVVAVLIFLPQLAGWAWWAYRRRYPSQVDRLARFQATVSQTESLRRQFTERAEWDEKLRYFGEFLVRDAERRLPHTLERHSPDESRYYIVSLNRIEREYLEFNWGSLDTRYIKQIGDSWYRADWEEEGAVKVTLVGWLRYEDIVAVRWDVDDYWEWPQICCRFPGKNKHPFEQLFYAERHDEGFPHPYYRRVCSSKEVEKVRPPGG